MIDELQYTTLKNVSEWYKYKIPLPLSLSLLNDGFIEKVIYEPGYYKLIEYKITKNGINVIKEYEKEMSMKILFKLDDDHINTLEFLKNKTLNFDEILLAGHYRFLKLLNKYRLVNNSLISGLGETELTELGNIVVEYIREYNINLIIDN